MLVLVATTTCDNNMIYVNCIAVLLSILYNLPSVASGTAHWYVCELLTCAEECLIEDIRNYRYLTHGNVPVAGQDDEELYRQLLEAMNIMGFSKEEQLGECNFAAWLQYVWF